MILTVTPNAAVDKTYTVAGFALDRVNRPSLVHTVAGGKGINVARVYQTLGGKAVAAGFLAGNNGRIVARAMAAEGIENACVRAPGETRLCIAAIDPDTGTQTEINESGPTTTPAAIRALKRQIQRLLSLSKFRFVVLSGSLPPGAPPDLYAELIEIARSAGVPVLLDTSGVPLVRGIEARPWLIKPNQAELAAVIGRPISTVEETLGAARELQARGAERVAATLGPGGAILVDGNVAWLAKPPPICFASAVASGDSFVAALLWSWLHGPSPAEPQEALRMATGAGAANAEVIGAGFCSRDSILDRSRGVKLERLAAVV